MRPLGPIALAGALLVPFGCSDDDGEGGQAAATTASVAPDDDTPATGTADSPSSGPTTARSTSPSSVPLRPTVPETGVPGLDSADVVCRSWSRFAGSFQVVAVAASFAEGGPVAALELEVAAAPTVSGAYEELLASWPVELAAERDVVAADYLGPFARRAARAREALVAAGATATDLVALTAAWETALADRDPTSPAFELALDERLATLVETAGATFAAGTPAITDDPSLVVTAATPATDAYIEVNCPDQGTLGGEQTG